MCQLRIVPTGKVVVKFTWVNKLTVVAGQTLFLIIGLVVGQVIIVTVKAVVAEPLVVPL